MHTYKEVLMAYKSICLDDFIHIERLYTVHYFEYMRDFSFEGESHDFWEFIYVDKGAVRISMDDVELVLKKGEIAFHQPNEFHKVVASEDTAPNLVVVSFDCTSPAMKFFKHQVLHIDDREHSLLAEILIEARKLLDCPLDNPYTQYMPKKSSAPSDCEQYIRLCLELFLLHIRRRYTSSTAIPDTIIKKNRTELFMQIVEYMENHISSKLTVEQICHDNMIGRTQLQKVFQKECGMGVIEYFSKLKINTAKHMIRSSKLNFSQISEKLGYTSVHYFSRQFKKITDMTPSEYESSVKARTEQSNYYK